MQAARLCGHRRMGTRRRTEPGSSRVSLFDPPPRHRPTVRGVCSIAGSVNNGQPDWYGRFDVTYKVGLSDYLDPAGTGTEVWDGYPDGAVTFRNDRRRKHHGLTSGALRCGTSDH